MRAALDQRAGFPRGRDHSRRGWREPHFTASPWVHRLKAEQHTLGPESQRNLLDEHARIRRQNELIRVDPVQKQLEEEAEILQSIRAAKELKSVAENALGIEYTKPAETSWEAPR